MKKICTVAGIMGFLIAFELLALFLSMSTLSSVRAFIAGEGVWSKSQKDSLLNLQRYGETQNEVYYDRFLQGLANAKGDSISRLELLKEKPDFEKVKAGFIQGGVHPNDINGVIRLIYYIRNFEHFDKAMNLWLEADALLENLRQNAEKLHYAIETQAPYKVIFSSLDHIYTLNDQLTKVENAFSTSLGEGSRSLEKALLIFMFFSVLLLESAGFVIVLSLNRHLSQSLNELYIYAEQIGAGKLDHRVPIRSSDELGRLATVINKMTADLRSNILKRERAENANRVKSLFLANMSHEIRTPLGAIQGFSELLKDKSLSTEVRDQYVNVISRTSNNLTNIINDILDLSKVESGHFEIEKVKFSIKNLVADINQTTLLNCLNKNIRFEFNGIENLPDIIYSDPVRIRQILNNLISNAIKFTNSGVIKFNYFIKNKNLYFTIEDSGIGISSDHCENLFQSFRQVDSSTTRKYEGTGLGLILSRRLANLLDGNVVLLKSEPKVGSIFSFHIALDESKEVSTSADPEPIEKQDLSLFGKSVLLVEDIEDNRVLIQHILSKKGIQVTTASNGSEGVDIAMKEHFDLILMDIQMPIMDGYMATKTLRKLGYNKPIIALTAHAMKEDRLRCLEVGCNEYLTKPLRVNILLETISKFDRLTQLHSSVNLQTTTNLQTGSLSSFSEVT